MTSGGASVGRVVAVSASNGHTFSKPNRDHIVLVEGLGVEGDIHAGAMVKDHRGAMVANLRQVHLIHAELFEDLAAKGFTVRPGDIGENITTEGVDLLALPEHARLHLGATAIVELKGLRAPCIQIDRFAKGLAKAVISKSRGGPPQVKSGVMGIVVAGGEVLPGDAIRVELPEGEAVPLVPI